jgi:hypothetical protein
MCPCNETNDGGLGYERDLEVPRPAVAYLERLPVWGKPR